MKYSLIIPCYNESKNIPFLAKRLENILNDKSFQIVIVDNGSTDNSSFLLKKLNKEYSSITLVKIEKNLGYGYGILRGIKEAKGEYIAWTHADLQTDPNDIYKGIEFLTRSSNKHFIKGIRYGRPISDRLFTIGMSFFASVVLGRFFWDINAQPSIFHSSFVKSWKNPPNDFSLDLYVYYLALKNNYDVKRFPVRFSNRIYGISSWNINWQSKLKFIKRTIIYTFKLKKRIN